MQPKPALRRVWTAARLWVEVTLCVFVLVPWACIVENRSYLRSGGWWKLKRTEGKRNEGEVICLAVFDSTRRVKYHVIKGALPLWLSKFAQSQTRNCDAESIRWTEIIHAHGHNCMIWVLIVSQYSIRVHPRISIAAATGTAVTHNTGAKSRCWSPW